MFFETIVIALVIGLVLKGKLSNLKNISLCHIELFLIAFIIQFLLDYFCAQGIEWLKLYRGYIHIFSYIPLFLGLYLNRNVPGIKLLGMGVFLNFIVVTANQGLMPVRADYLPPHMIDILSAGNNGTHSLLNDGMWFKFLADQIYIPLPYQKQMLSFGDIVMDIGIFYMIIYAIKDSSGYVKFTYIDRRL